MLECLKYLDSPTSNRTLPIAKTLGRWSINKFLTFQARRPYSRCHASTLILSCSLKVVRSRSSSMELNRRWLGNCQRMKFLEDVPWLMTLTFVCPEEKCSGIQVIKFSSRRDAPCSSSSVVNRKASRALCYIFMWTIFCKRNLSLIASIAPNKNNHHSCKRNLWNWALCVIVRMAMWRQQLLQMVLLFFPRVPLRMLRDPFIRQSS